MWIPKTALKTLIFQWAPPNIRKQIMNQKVSETCNKEFTSTLSEVFSPTRRSGILRGRRVELGSAVDKPDPLSYHSDPHFHYTKGEKAASSPNLKLTTPQFTMPSNIQAWAVTKPIYSCGKYPRPQEM